VISSRRPIISAVNLVGVMVNLALMYLTLNASFVAAVQIMVYAGAIMVLFVFVIMLLKLDIPKTSENHAKGKTWVALFSGLLFLEVLSAVFLRRIKSGDGFALLPQQTTSALDIGKALFTPQWIVPFEAVSVLLLVATIGAVVLAVRRLS